jgi:hypothetical protein
MVIRSDNFPWTNFLTFPGNSKLFGLISFTHPLEVAKPFGPYFYPYPPRGSENHSDHTFILTLLEVVKTIQTILLSLPS